MLESRTLFFSSSQCTDKSCVEQYAFKIKAHLAIHIGCSVFKCYYSRILLSGKVLWDCILIFKWFN